MGGCRRREFPFTVEREIPAETLRIDDVVIVGKERFRVLMVRLPNKAHVTGVWIQEDESVAGWTEQQRKSLFDFMRRNQVKVRRDAKQFA